MDLQLRIKHINKKLTKFSRLVFVILAVVGILLSAFISNISQFKFNKADTLVSSNVASISTNAVFKLVTLKDSSDRIVTYTNQFASFNIQINSHYDASDYNLFNSCETGINTSDIITKDSIGTDSDGYTYILDNASNDLKIYPFDICSPTVINLNNVTLADEVNNSVKYNEATGDLFIAQDSRLIRLPNGGLANAEVYPYASGRNAPVSMTIDPDNNFVYVLFGDANLQQFEVNNSMNINEYYIGGVGISCAQKIIYQSSTLFVSDECNNNVFAFNNSIVLQNSFLFDATITDFIVNNDYLYVTGQSHVTKFDRISPYASTISDTPSNVGFVSLDLLGNDVFNLSYFFRDIYKFTLTIGPGGGCPVDTPPYVHSNTLCERWLFDSSNANVEGDTAIQSVVSGTNLAVLHQANDGTGGIYTKNDNTFYPFPAGDFYPRAIRASLDGNGVYVLFEEDDSIGGGQSILYFDFSTGYAGSSYPLPGGQEFAHDFVVDPFGNMVTINHDGAGQTSLTLFVSGNLANPSVIEPDFNFGSSCSPKMSVDGNANLYIICDNELRVISFDAGTYDVSSMIDTSSYNIGNTSNIFVKHNPLGGEDVYVSGSTPAVISAIHKFSNVDLNAGFDSDAEYITGYGQYNSYGFSAFTVDANNNIFAVPPQSATQLAWFSEGGTLHDFDLDLAGGFITDVALDISNNLYVTSEAMNYQLYLYDSVPFDNGGGGDICPVVTPAYIYNIGRCERYTPGAQNTDYFGTSFSESILVNGTFVALTAGINGAVYVDGDGNHSLPFPYINPRRIMQDPRVGINGIVFLATDNTDNHRHILTYNIDTFTFTVNDQGLNSDNIDIGFTSDGTLYEIGSLFGSTALSTFDPQDDYNFISDVILDFDYTCNGTDQVRMKISDNIIYAICQNSLRIMAPPYTSSTEIDLSSYNFDTSLGITSDLFVKKRFNGTADLYVSGSDPSFNPKIERFLNLKTNGTFDGNLEMALPFNEFGSTYISDIYVDSNNSIIVIGDSGTDQIARFTPAGELQILDLANTTGGTTEDILVDSNNDIYVTSQTIAYQILNYGYVSPSVGANPCLTGGGLDLSSIFAGDPVHLNGFVDGDPDPFPLVYPTGSLEIRANGSPIAYAPLNGTADTEYDFTIFTVGSYTISVYYPGDETYASCSQNIGSMDVAPASSGALESQTDFVSITPSNGKQVTGEPLSISFHVSDPNNVLNIPTGDLELRKSICCSGGYITLATGTLDGSGNITFNLNNIFPDEYLYYGQYLGDTTYQASASSTNILDIYAIQTFTSLESSDNPIVKGNSITLTAHVTLPDFTPSLSSPVSLNPGRVTFKVGSTIIGFSDSIDSNGFASIVVNTSDSPVGFENLDAGVHNIRAYYSDLSGPTSSWFRKSNSETLFQSVTESGSGGGSDSGSDIPPSGGEGGNSDFSATITGKDKVTGSTTDTKIGSILSWVMNYNNLGPNSNPAVTYFPIRENQDFVIGSVKAPVTWLITYSQDQGCDDSSFTYTPVGSNGNTDPLVRCVRFENDRISVPPTRSDIRYINTSANFTELNVSAFGGDDIYKVVTYNNKLFYFNHHWLSARVMTQPQKTIFCFDLEINDTCVSSNPNIVYPVVLGMDGFSDDTDEWIQSRTSFAANAEIVNDKMYIPISDVEFNDEIGNGHGFACWDLATDYYCASPGLKEGTAILDNFSFKSWGFGNVGDVQYNPDRQELYTANVGTAFQSQIMCFSLQTNLPCPGQPYALGTITGFDPQWHTVEYQHSSQRIYTAAGNQLDRFIQCLDAVTKTVCSDFPAAGVKILPDKPNQSVFLNRTNDQICAFLYSDGPGADNGPPKVYCYDANLQTWYDYMPDMVNTAGNVGYGNLEVTGPYPDGKLFFGGDPMYCFDLVTKEPCIGWEGGKAGSPFDSSTYTSRYAFGCMWGASHTGRVYTFSAVDGGPCNPLITLTEGNVAVKLDANNMFCATSDSSINWNKVKVLDSGTTPSPAILNTTVYDSTQCSTDEDGLVSCTGSPLKSGNLLLNSGHELDISDISYSAHKSLTAILEFQYPSVPSPAPGFYIELNPTNKAQMCAETKLLFSGALCANPITVVCENTNINYINDPVSNNNGGQYCLNVETYFGKDPNSALCFVATTPEQRIFTVFNPNATVATGGTPVNFNPEQTYNRGPGNYSFGNGFFGFFQNLIENTVPQIVNQETIREVVSNISTQTPLAVTAVTAVTTATVVVTGVFAAGSGVGQIFGLLIGFITPRKKKYWGIIFDDLTNKPIAFASITLSTKEIGTNNEIKSTVVTQSVSDLDGRYRLNTTKRDKFYIEVKASGYQPFNKFISMANPLNSAEDIVFDISLRRIDAKASLFKGLFSYRKKAIINISRFILLLSSIVGFIFTIYTQINFPNNLNLILLAVYVGIFMVSFYPSIYSRIQKRGKVVDVDLNASVPGAVVRIYDTKQQIALSLTNETGEARFDLPAGEYSILASKRGYIMVAEEGKQLIKAVLKQEGYLDRNILMKRVEEQPLAPESGLDNPFA